MTAIATALALVLATTPPADPPVEQTKKNIKILQGLPSSQLIPTMAFMANSLGVTCSYCHTKQFESDEKPTKETARRMIALQRSINQQHFAGKLAVTCNTCHQGHVETPAIPEVMSAGWNQKATPAVAYVAGEAVVERLPEPKPGVTKRVVRGTVERDNGHDEPKSAPFTLTFNGDDITYETELSHPPEARRAFVMYLLQRPKPEQLRGERWTIAPDRITRYRETPTPLGTLPEQYDFDNFRDGLPYRARWSRADYRVTFAIETIE